MLKIKDDVDLKELEKFGYKWTTDDVNHEAYVKYLEYGDYIAIYENKRYYIDIEDFCGSSWDELEEELLEDLIVAGIIEKVGE